MTTLPLTIPSLHAAYQSGTSPAQVIEQVYARINEVNDPGIFIYLFDKTEVLEAAQALGAYDPAKPLWGIPFAIKDNIDAAGKITTAACPAYAYDATEDAFVVKALRDAGALLIGKTNLDQFATGLVGVRTPYGAPLNAIDPQIVPGGSSGGSGVVVGHGIVTFSLGTDTAGSGRVPAALNNIIGLKPTLGSLSATGLVPACRTLDTISIFALTVEDAYTAFQSASVYDPVDSYARDIAAPDLTAVKPGLKIGIPSAASIKFFGDTAQEASFAATVATLKDQGFEVSEIDFTPLYDIADMLYYGAWVAERYTVIEELLKQDASAVYPVTSRIIGTAATMSAADAFRGMYRLKDLIRQAEPFVNAVDMLCVPTIPTFYTVADLEADPITPNNNLGTYTNFVNFMDMCGIAVPSPARSDGRPGSVTFLAKAGEDALVASMAMRIEALGTRNLGATDWPFTPSEPLPEANASTVQIAVCGAHMAGLPLNHQLATRGATFLRATTTNADYEFFALPGGPPYRPGLVRTKPGQGREIAVEVWDMPTAELGSFLAGIPSPLGLGTVHLGDGNSVLGFLCESIATQGATDITELGDWRLYQPAAE